MRDTLIYIAVMAVVTYLIRVLPLTLIRREIHNVTIRSFLYYIPYVTLSVMTFPAILDSTGSQLSGLPGAEQGFSSWRWRHACWCSSWSCSSAEATQPARACRR